MPIAIIGVIVIFASGALFGTSGGNRTVYRKGAGGYRDSDGNKTDVSNYLDSLK